MQAQPVNEATDANRFGGNFRVKKTLIWIGVAGLSAALAFTVARAMIAQRTEDPTSRRIQQLIDEANQLLKTLDDKRNPS